MSPTGERLQEPVRVLLVEDDPELAGALAAALSRQYKVVTSTDARTALAAVAGGGFGLVVLDLILPGGTGMQVLAALDQQPGGAPPVLVMSGVAREVDLSAFDHLVVGRLAKPFGLEEAEAAVRDALAGRRRAPVAPRPPGAAVLLVDDDHDLLDSLADSLRQAGYRVATATAPAEAMGALSREFFDAVACDWILPGGNGVDLLGQIRALVPQVPVLLMTGYGTPELVRRATAAGAAAVLAKPFSPRTLLLALETCLQRAAADPGPAPLPPPAPARAAAARAATAPALRYTVDDIAGESRAIQRARQALLRAAALDSTVLIRGETGTGKELFAQALHQLSARARGPFVAVNAAAIPESLLESELFGYASGAFTGARREGQQGKFLQAHGGTLFLDEIGDLSLPLQAKLLRVLQEGEVDLVGGGHRRVDVRVVAATHRDLAEMVARGAFRSDLYYRLNVVTLELPPLRERPEDIPILATRFLAALGARYQRPGVAFSAGALDLLAAYPWPGNIRELRNVVEQTFAFATGDLLLPVHLPPAIQGARGPARPAPAPGALDLENQERQTILRALEAAGGNKVHAARLLGISRAGLYVKLKVYGIA